MLALVACGPPPVHPPASTQTRLAVLLVLDQWPEWAFETKRPHLTNGGFERLLSEGAWSIGEHPSLATLTAPGHALLGSGAATNQSGVLANEWYHRELDQRLASVAAPDGARTSQWSRVPGLGDSVTRAGGKAVAIALKDRSAILSLGHAGMPIWYDKKQVAWTSFEVPPWLVAHNAAHPISVRIHEVWKPLDPALLATRSGIEDDSAGELGEKRFGGVFPHDPDVTGDAADAVFATPTGNEIAFEAALAAIAGEQLGTRATPDLLVISLSAHDYVGHGWGHESWEMWDTELRIDRELTRFLAALDQRVGVGNWSMIVTSDHGASPVPERIGKGGRLLYETVHDVAQHAAASVLGDGAWIADAKYPNVFFSAALAAKPAAVRDAVALQVRQELRALPGVAWVEPKASLGGHCETRTGTARAICLGIDLERSGELIWMPAEHWITQDLDEPVATGHGSIYPYDRRVPLILLAPGRTTHPPATEPGELRSMTEVAPLLARWLRVTAPLELR